MCLKRYQLKCKENSKAKNITLDFGVVKNILKEVILFTSITSKQWIEEFLRVDIIGNYMSKNLENGKHKVCLRTSR